MIAARISNIPWSLTLHGISETDHPAGQLLSAKLEDASFVACASFFMQAQGMRRVNIGHWDKFHVVRCGIDFDAIPQERVSKPTERQAHQLICVGRLSPEKGYFGLLKALSKLAARGLDFNLTIVGDGPASEHIRSFADDVGLHNHVSFVGYLSEHETLKAIGQADALVLASLMEGLPVVLLEALAMGKPVLASRVAGIPELIEHDVTGLLFTPSDWDDLELQLERLLTKSESWHLWGKAGRRRVIDQFRIQDTGARMARLFCEK
jgi:glycosyltransferase involved in cell wall biosynthesis